MQVCPLCRLTLSDSETSCPRDGHAGIAARLEEVPAVVRARFNVVQPYAQGASGDLYIADDQQTGRRGVLKMLRVPANVTPAEKARLKRELVKQATLANPSLAVPLATGDANGVPWVFREWIEGVSLRVKLTRGGALAVPEALAIAAQIASALDELHRAGLLHRDLKPGHVILNPQPHGLPRVSIIDAGIAARIETSSVFDVMGTPEYVSPEQAKGKLVSFRSDLYALGCVLYEMLTGTPPFTGTPAQLLEAHANEAPPTPKLELPSNVSTLLAQLLAKEPRERPFSAQQVRRALEPFLPEDASSKREATQTFEKAAQSAAAPAAPSGTLRPRPGKSTVIGMPAHTPSKPPPPPPQARKPKVDGTEELSPLDLEQAEEIAGGAKAGMPSKTLMGLGPGKHAADSTDELSAMDLEDAEEAIATVARATPLAVPGPSNGAGPAVPAPQAPPPWQQTRITDHGGGEGLDYDDLETIAVDREGRPDATPAPAQAAATPPPTAQPAPTPVHAAPVAAPTKKKKRSPIVALVALVAVVGVCGLTTVGAAGALWFFMGEGSTEIASPIFEPGPSVEPPVIAPPVVPTPPPVPPPVAPAVQPPPPIVAQPLPPPPPEPVVQPTPPPQPEPVAEPAPPPQPEPVARSVEEPRPGPRQAQTERRQTEQARAAEPREEGSESRASRFEQARQEALAHFQAGRFAEAAQAYERATELNPRHAGSYAGLGAARLAQGQHAAAIRAYQRAVALQPRHAGYHAALGRAYLESGDRAHARESFARALELDPSNQTARMGMQRVGG